MLKWLNDNTGSLGRVKMGGEKNKKVYGVVGG
jgi:hypothetical protein